MDFQRAVPINGVSEEYAHVADHPCPQCGGQWKVRLQALMLDEKGRHYDRMDVYCPDCNRRQSFLFDIHAFFPKREG